MSGKIEATNELLVIIVLIFSGKTWEISSGCCIRLLGIVCSFSTLFIYFFADNKGLFIIYPLIDNTFAITQESQTN